MTEDTAGTDQSGVRRSYLKPYVRNLDVVDTQGKEVTTGVEFTPSTLFHAGPS
jgi:hypothetical protein